VKGKTVCFSNHRKQFLEYEMRGKVTFQVPTSINYRILYKEICIVNNVVKYFKVSVYSPSYHWQE